MNKKGWVKLSNMGLLYYGLGTLTGCFVLWISLSEGKRLHYLDMEIMPSGQNFIINVEANGEDVDIFASEKGVHVTARYTGISEDQYKRIKEE